MILEVNTNLDLKIDKGFKPMNQGLNLFYFWGPEYFLYS